MIFLLIWSPMSGLPLSATMSLKLAPFGIVDRRIRHAGVFVADVLDEQQDQDVVLVLAGVHAAAQLVATGPKGAVEFGFFESHVLNGLFCGVDKGGGIPKFGRERATLC